MFDTHIHTEFSPDSGMKIKAAIERAEMLSLGLIITEHMDPNTACDGSYCLDIGSYFNAYLPYKGSRLLVGVELGMVPELDKVSGSIIDSYPVDYVIGSIHVVGRHDIESSEFFEEGSQDDVYRSYLSFMLENLRKYTFINSLAHIDYISRYCPYEEKEVYREGCYDLIDEIFRLLIENDIALEINTRRFGDKKAVDNMNKLCRRYKELKGRHVTLGTDSHRPEGIGRKLQEARHIAESNNLSIVYFKDRKICYEK